MNNMRMRLLLSTALMVMPPVVDAALAQSATWDGGLGPNYADPGNWTPNVVPTDTATFGATGSANVSNVSGSIGAVQFNAGSQAYDLSLGSSYSINGAGIVNGSAFTQQLTLGGVNNVLGFYNSATIAGGDTYITTNNSSNAAIVSFFNNSSAGNARINADAAGGAVGFRFNDAASAGSSTITLDANGSALDFLGGSTAGAATITTAGFGTVIDFSATSTAAGASFNIAGTSNSLDFYNSASAGNASITVGGTGNTLFFVNNSTAGSATINLNQGQITFDDSGSAGTAVFNTISTTQITFKANTTAANGTFNLDGTTVNFNNNSTAGSATFTTANIMPINFNDAATAGSATFNIDDLPGANFNNASTAGSAKFVLTNNGAVAFNNTASGGTAAFNLAGGSTMLDFSSATSGTNQIGSLAGSGGTVYLGKNVVSIGGNNQSTTFGGVIADCGGDCSAVGNALPLGPGGLTKTGTGTLTLTGANTYTGGTVITGGTLQIGNGGITGSITGNVVSSGTLTFNRSNAYGFAGVISGSGAVNLNGAGALTFSAAQTYAGATTIASGGSLALTGAGNLASSALTANGTFDISGVTSGAAITSLTGSGSVTLGAKTLTISNPGNATFSGILSGTGGLTLAGGHEILTGNSPAFTGATTVNGGTLSVNGAINASPVTVNSGGTLGGTGTVGLTTIASGGTLAPGNSIGTLKVAGNLVFASGSTYHVEVSPTASDLTTATGTASLNGAVQADFGAGTYTAGTRYTIVTSTGALSGTFASLSTPGLPAGFSASLSYDANDAYLVLLGGDAQAGLIQANMANAYLVDERLIRNAVLDHLVTPADGVRVWGESFAAFGAVGVKNPMDHNHNGFIAGVDMPLGDGFTLGVAGAWTGYKLSMPSKTSTARGATGHAMGYVAWNEDAAAASGWNLKLGGEYGWGAVNTQRVSSATETNIAHRSANTAQVFGEAAYRIHFEGADLEPHGSIFWVMGQNGAYSETGGLNAMAGTGIRQDASFARLGVRGLGRWIDLGGIEIAPSLNIGWQMALSNQTPGMTVNYLTTPATTALLTGTAAARNAGTAQLGLGVKLGDDATLNLGYDGIFAMSQVDHGVTARLAWKF